MAALSPRRQVLRFLGERCITCGFSDWRGLQIDMKDGNHRKILREKFKNSDNSFYRFYNNNPFKCLEELQVLCANCNQIKRYEANELGKKK